jgi:two-component system, sensor histidine kinase YesM
MIKFLEKLKYQGLFVKLFLVMVISITAVSVLTSWTMIQMSERLFIKTFSITNSKVIGNIRSDLESFNHSIVKAVTDVQLSGTIRSFLTEKGSNSLRTSRLYYNTKEQMDRIKSYMDAYEVGITMIGVNGREYVTDRSYWKISMDQLYHHEITNRARKEPKRLVYQYYREKTPQSDGVIVATKALIDRTTGKIYGMLYISIREKEFKRFYNDFTSTGNDVVILDRTGMVLSSNRGKWIGRRNPGLLKDAREIVEAGSDYKNGRVMGKHQLILAEYLPDCILYLVNLIDRDFARSQMVNVKAVTAICLLIISVSLVIVFFISRRLTRSLSTLARQMSNITKRDFGNYISVSGSYEIRMLAQAFNYMLDELNEYVKKLLETQRKQRKAELAALQNQINPHFLYNTLASIKMLVLKGSKDKAADTINALISVLQNTIGNGDEMVSVEQEISNLKNYVFINHVRYGGRIQVHFFVAPDCSHFKIPKMIIQPFIENAFFHAFRVKQEGYIHVLISKDPNFLICEVIDNGDGMEGITDRTFPPLKSKRQLFRGIGIQNVDERIKLLYGEKYGVTIASNPGEGTRVKIRLPLITA